MGKKRRGRRTAAKGSGGRMGEEEVGNGGKEESEGMYNQGKGWYDKVGDVYDRRTGMGFQSI